MKRNAKKKSIRRKKQNRIMLVDGDVLVYAQCTNTAFLTEMHNEDDEWWEVLNAKAVKDEISARIDQLEGMLACDSVVVVFGSRENFRKKLDPTYKSQRKRKPLGYHAMVEWVRGEYECTTVPGLEADDVLGVLHTLETFKQGRETVIVSNDKDMRTLPGLLYNPDKIEQLKPEVITPRMAAQQRALQALTGDSSDGYKGCPGLGAKTAPLLIEPHLDAAMKAPCPDTYLFRNAIVPAFEKAKLTEADALLQTRLARILRSSDLEVLSDGTWDYRMWAPIDTRPLPGRRSKRSSKKVS